MSVRVLFSTANAINSEKKFLAEKCSNAKCCTTKYLQCFNNNHAAHLICDHVHGTNEVIPCS